MRIAILGGGCSGLVTAWLLQHHHQVEVFEKIHPWGSCPDVEQECSCSSLLRAHGNCHTLSFSMKKYVAIIRGINVGGHNRVNMKQLREALEKLKFQEVQTYIQSGNIVFRSEETSVPSLESAVGKVLKSKFDVTVPVIVRDEKEWKKTVRGNPFLDRTEELTKLLVTFLSARPAPADVKAIAQESFPHDEFAVLGKDVYVFCKEGYGKTDIPNLFFEKKLRVNGTTRNWRTVLEIEKMLTQAG